MHLQIEIRQSAILVAGGNAGFFQQLLVAGGDAAIAARHAAGFAGNFDLFPASSLTNGAGRYRLRLMLSCHGSDVTKSLYENNTVGQWPRLQGRSVKPVCTQVL